MPELPEVETTRRGIAPYLEGHRITQVIIHQPKLRWPIPKEVLQLHGLTVQQVSRRGKYLLLRAAIGTAILHLGMSGSLRISTAAEKRRKHDHVEFLLSTGFILRFHDPRRFGCLLWQATGAPVHTLLARLGPEPLTELFDAQYLFSATRRRSVAIKNLIMNSHVVVGVGNIYASEALFMAGISPGKAAKRISRKEAARLCDAIKKVLQEAIDKGGTTLRDFVNSDGNPGYFKQSLLVYDRQGEPCRTCGNAIKQRVLAQRSTYYCSRCQH